MLANRFDAPWLDDVERFVEVLEATQQELLATLRLKRRALASADVDDLQRLNAAATEVAQRLKSLTAWRSQLLEQAGQPTATLSDVLAQRAHLRPETLRGRLEAVQLRFGEARREAWVQWIVAQRAGGCYADILDLIARGGKKSPVYGDMPGGSGGAMIDTAV